MGAERGAAIATVAFVTGRLAEPALNETLRALEGSGPELSYHVVVLKITVAALMTTPWIAKFLEVPPDTDLVMIPGLCEGDPEVIAEKVGVKVVKGPKDLREIPAWFGHEAVAREYGAWDIEICAEINNVPRLSRDEVVRSAKYYHDSGADVIDLGLTPGRPYPDLASTVRELVASGLRVSVDSFDPGEIHTAVDAGASMVLSVNGSNRDVIASLAGTSVRVVAIPDFGAGLDTLDPTIDALEQARVQYLIDPVIEPIGYGFAASIQRYVEARRRYPDTPLFMGIGNLTELTAADTTGVNALLIAIAQELGVRAVLTTEVSPWARGCVREIDIARRLMHYAVTKRSLPKNIDDRLVTVKDPKILSYSEGDLKKLQSSITDANFRIFTDRDTITVLNAEKFVRGTDIQDIFNQLGVTEHTHAFYLGKELAKAKLAIQLGKTYRQEGQLNFGYLTPPDDPIKEHLRVTAKRERT